MLYPALVHLHAEVDCTPLIDWLRALVTSTVVKDVHAPPVTCISLMVPLADTDLLTHRDIYLKAALPGRHTAATRGLEHAVFTTKIF